MNQININYYKLKYFKYKLKYTLYKQNMFKDEAKLYNFNGVWTYSNGLEDECKLDELNYNNGYFTGIKWQCVEYARRYIQSVFGVTFSQVESAYEIPNAIFFPVKLSLRTTESSPKCALSRMVTMAPRNVIQMNKNRDSSSELIMPSLKP